jgi:hypothetical protein
MKPEYTVQEAIEIKVKCSLLRDAITALEMRATVALEQHKNRPKLELVSADEPARP